MMALVDVLLLMALIVWLLNRDEAPPRRARVLPFRPRPARRGRRGR